MANEQEGIDIETLNPENEGIYIPDEEIDTTVDTENETPEVSGNNVGDNETETTVDTDKENLKKAEKDKTSITLVDNIIEYIKNSENEKYLKITICDETKSIFNSVIRKLKQIKNIDVLDVSNMSRKVIKKGSEDINIEYYYTEISLAEVDKWNAIQYLSKKLNIEKENIIAIRG